MSAAAGYEIRIWPERVMKVGADWYGSLSGPGINGTVTYRGNLTGVVRHIEAVIGALNPTKRYSTPALPPLVEVVACECVPSDDDELVGTVRELVDLLKSTKPLSAAKRKTGRS